MTVNIIAIRGDGDISGEPIVDPLIGTVAVALQRGRNVLDSKSSSRQSIDFEAVYKPSAEIGDLVKMEDNETPETYKAKLVSISHTIRLGEATTSARLERYI